MLLSLPKVRANLQLLEDVIEINGKDLDEICQQIIKEDLNEGDVEILMTEVTELIDSSQETTNGLRARLLEAAAEIREANPSSGTSTPTQSSSSDPFSWQFQETLAQEIAKLKELRPDLSLRT